MAVARGNHPAAYTGSPSEEAVRDQLQRLLESRHFANAPRMRRFLCYVVEQTVRGEADLLKESLLGVTVFDKSSQFDPGIDPIVRIQAGRLRDRLRKYYRTDGRGDKLLIEIDKGTYVPCFRSRLLSSLTRKPKKPPQPKPKGRRLAILPFSDLSAEHDQEYFCDGLTEELISTLARIPGIEVIGWTSARRYRDAALDVRRIGTALRVDLIVEGSVRKALDRVRVSVRLARVGDGRYVWSETYESSLRDVFVFQDRIAEGVVSALQLGLDESQTARLTRRSMVDPEGYRLFLKGRYHARRRSQECLWKGIHYLEGALEANPSCAPALASLAEAYVLLGWYGFSPADDVMPKARAAALKAVEIDGQLAEAHMSLGLVRELYDWDWRGAEEELRLACKLDPGDATVLFEHGFFLSRTGRLEEALRLLRRASELDPLSPVVHTNMGVNLYYRRSYDEAIHCFFDALDLDENYCPAHFRLGMAYLQTGEPQAAIASLEKANALAGDCPSILGRLGYALAVSGDRAGARHLLAQLKNSARSRYVRPLAVVFIQMGLGEISAAFQWLEKACREHDSQLVDIEIDPLYDVMRGDPRYRPLLRKMNLPA